MGLSGACIIFENYKYLMGGVLKFINKKKDINETNSIYSEM
jgi:hypothetical protein|nr:MAG TPA: hypothetical protein [Bacteriophage sp.]